MKPVPSFLLMLLTIKIIVRLSTLFADAIRHAVSTIHEPEVFKHLQMQQDFVKNFIVGIRKK
jgi:hypothetical protein